MNSLLTDRLSKSLKGVINMKKKIIVGIAAFAAILIPVVGVSSVDSSARGGFGDWPFSVTK